MPKMISACMVFNEIDMLELRLQILRDVVDVHIIVEAGETHSGKPKGAPIGEVLLTPRFAEFSDKIVYYYQDHLEGDNSWTRERMNRWLISKPLALVAQPDDLVCVSDCDELPNPNALANVPPTGAALELDFRYYSFHWRVKQGWGIGVLPYKSEADPNCIRTLAGHTVPAIKDAGFHLSYFSSPVSVTDKIRAFMHHDWAEKDTRVLDEKYIAERMKKGEDIWDRGLPIEYEQYPANLPVYVRDNQQKYIELGWLEGELVLK